jgi:hypothetical protein
MSVKRLRKLWDVETLLQKGERGYLRIPEFQRGKVWNIKKRSEAIYSLLTIGLPDLVFMEQGEGLYLLDGLQRFYAISSFVNNEYPIKLDKNLSHIDENLAQTLEGKYFKDLPEDIKNALLNSEIGAVIYTGVNSFEIAREIFTRINYKPTPLSQQELLYVLTFDREKSILLRELGEKLTPKGLKGFGILARLNADYLLLEEGIEESSFKFSKYYDWLYSQLVKAFQRWTVKEIEEITLGGMEFISLLKAEGIDAVKAPYWIEVIAFLLRDSYQSGLEPMEYWKERGQERVKQLQQNPRWIRHLMQRNKQKPKVLKERFEILNEVFPKAYSETP